MKRVHGLDTIRMIGEFFVVYFHMAMGEPHSFGVHDFGYDLISLFFLLSGCVCSLKLVDTNPTPKTRQEALAYIKKKWMYVFPLYFFVCVCSLIGNIFNRIIDHTRPCPWMVACYALDFFALGPWFNCGVLTLEVCSAGWYIVVVLYCWILFPFIQHHLHQFWLTYTWCKLVLVHILLTCVVYGFIYLRLDSFYFLPPRVLEFLLGTGIPFTQNNKAHYLCVLFAVIGTTSMYLSVHYSLQYQEDLCLKIIRPYCTVLSPGWFEEQPQVPCSTFLRRIWCKTDFTWILIIHYILTREDVMNWEFFNILNPISLTLYLSHLRVHEFIRFLLSLVELQKMLTDTMSVVTCYAGAYYLHKAYQHVYTQCTQYMYSSLPNV